MLYRHPTSPPSPPCIRRRRRCCRSTSIAFRAAIFSMYMPRTHSAWCTTRIRLSPCKTNVEYKDFFPFVLSLSVSLTPNTPLQFSNSNLSSFFDLPGPPPPSPHFPSNSRVSMRAQLYQPAALRAHCNRLAVHNTDDVPHAYQTKLGKRSIFRGG